MGAAPAAGPLRARLAAQLLGGGSLGGSGVEPVVRHLLAVQAQDLRGARLAIRARTRNLTAADVDTALGEERSLIVTWLNRGTLHLVARDDYAWLHTLTAPRIVSANARRLAEEGVDAGAAERGVGVIAKALSSEGALTRAQLRERLDSAGVPTAGQALVHLLMAASLRGLTVRGPVVDGEQAHVLVADWLGERPAVDREEALAELARRYLRGHGPAGERDLARWAGITLGDARRGLGAIVEAGEAREIPVRSGGSARVERAERTEGPRGRREGSEPAGEPLLDLATRAEQEPPPLPPPLLLGPFDPVLHGWIDREPLLGEHGRVVVTVNGIFRAIALVEGRAVATWRMPGGRVELEPFDAIPEAASATLEREAADVVRFLGGA